MKKQTTTPFARILARKHLSISKLSAVTGIPQSTLFDWSSGRLPRSILRLKHLADFLEITIDQLVDEINELSTEKTNSRY